MDIGLKSQRLDEFGCGFNKEVEVLEETQETEVEEKTNCEVNLFSGQGSTVNRFFCQRSTVHGRQLNGGYLCILKSNFGIPNSVRSRIGSARADRRGLSSVVF
ncbi:hypothetical protein [Algoriphagus sp. CAU 1675]|uniref:hypothetical protein n=1 Tax=Algoriphagus sp. CAU 1675 TaxID=3032597 RepID=UPI0023DA9305|nr:hypothetical protein [Algoriphagus sp. CAU 1675]MDF2159412.1 hypothetical protein [Algoriphagus sp. CAU 1675]